MARRLQVSGLVQGVGYRASFAALAGALGLRGWVRNRRDGTVEAVVEGNAPELDQMVDWARRGPPAARVSGLVQTEEPDCGATRFEILPTV